MKRLWLIGAIALGVVIVVVAVIAVVGIVGDQPTAQPDREELPVNIELIKQARPEPGCAKVPRPKPAGSGDVELGVIRLRGHCLISETVVVAEADAAARLAELRQQQDVVAADRADVPQPPAEPRDIRPAVDGVEEKQWGLDALGGAAALHDLWPADAPEIKIGVVDSGIDPKQAEFGDRVIAIRDTVLGSDRYESHGTAVAGIIASAADGTGVTGLVPKAKLLDAQYWRDGVAVGESGIHDEIIWAVDQGARVINLSSGANDSSLLRAAYEYAELSSVVLVPAVGNCGHWTVSVPDPPGTAPDPLDPCKRGRNQIAGQADQPTVLGVGALNEEHRKAGFSSKNRTVMIMAPGEAILSTCVTRTAGPRSLCVNDGTSFAAPFVTGAVAILLARHPEASPADIRQALITTTDPIETVRGQRNDAFGYGKLNVIAAAKYLDDHPPQPQPEQPVITAAARTGSKVELIMDNGKKLAVQQLGQGGTPAFAFSADGAWFAAADGKTLTVVDAYTGRQQSTECGCSGVAFNTKGQVLAAQTHGGLKIAQYDPMTADWTGTTYAPKLSGGLDSAKLVGAAGDVALVTLSQGEYANRLVGVWPDSTATELDGGGLAYTMVAASATGRFVVASSPQSCPRVIDVEKTRSTGKPWTKWLWYDDIFCATSMLAHFDGDKALHLGWLGSQNMQRKPACLKPGQEREVPVTGRLPIGEFTPSRDPVDLPWKDLDCTASGVWPLKNGAQVRARGSLGSALPLKYTLVLLKPNGEGEQNLAEQADEIAVRTR
ncbi:S8 family peptidase [Microlunatus parietis]|uniref:Peptidase S8/S53 domain-containing protein n=1 Tax=Microlunatus parietis TaxID=682979 RepID=A0A7Y9I1Y6_9ACTN|nr:S8 family serine peptidase [Microlunatus parietis]NYE68724.1 hypothetical protein [Microlunatus parietis]